MIYNYNLKFEEKRNIKDKIEIKNEEGLKKYINELLKDVVACSIIKNSIHYIDGSKTNIIFEM